MEELKQKLIGKAKQQEELKEIVKVYDYFVKNHHFLQSRGICLAGLPVT